jgi:hypothetical protein
MNHIHTFQQYNEGFLSKAAATAALGISALAPQKAHGQLGHKIKDFVKKEVSIIKKSNLPKPGETKIIDNKELNNLSLDDYQSFGNLPLSRLPEGKYMITTTIAQTKTAGEMQALQALKMNAENKKIVRVFNYNKELKNGNIQIVSIAQLK